MKASKDGRLLRELLGESEDERLGLSLVDAGDLDGDGTRDLAIGGPSATLRQEVG